MVMSLSTRMIEPCFSPVPRNSGWTEETRRWLGGKGSSGESNSLPVVGGVEVFRMRCQKREASIILRYPGKQLRGQVIFYSNHDRDPLMLRKLDLGKRPEHTVLIDGLECSVFRHIVLSLCGHLILLAWVGWVKRITSKRYHNWVTRQRQ